MMRLEESTVATSEIAAPEVLEEKLIFPGLRQLDETDVYKVSTLSSPISVDSSDQFDSEFNVTPIESLIKQWVGVAMRHAFVRKLDEIYVADVAGVRGAWSTGDTLDAAYDSLRNILTDWVRLKLDDCDTDIPQMEGVKLIIDG